MIDVQSLLWTAGWQLGQSAKPPEEPARPARCWKVAPGEGASVWSDWQEHAHISVGWEQLGDLSELTPDEWPAHRDRICGEYGWTTTSADQCWRFAADIAPGDRIVANRGTKGILGFGTVVGEYYFVPDEPMSHRMPVRWDDVRPRALPQPNPGWRRTLLKLSPGDFDALLALPPDSDEATLGPPFDLLFADRAEAEAALDLMADALGALGVTANDDKRFAVTYATNSRRLTLDYGPWCVMRCWPVEQARRLQLALLEQSGVLDDLPVDFRFKEAAEDRAVVLRTMEPSVVDDHIRSVSIETAREAKALFGHRQSSNWRKYHVDAIGTALLDPAKRADLLAYGLGDAVPDLKALAAPFDTMFVDRDEAEWAFDLLAQAFVTLGVRAPDDPRIALTLPNGGRYLHLSIANWLILGFEPLADTDVPDMTVALLSDTPGIERFRGGAFKTSAGDTEFSLKRVPRDAFRSDPAFPTTMVASQEAILRFFSGLQASSRRKHHCPELADAVLDAAARDELLTVGLDEYRRQHGGMAENAAFSTEARDLLVALAAEPTKTFYAAHKDELTKHVQEPVQTLLRAVAERVEPHIGDAMETKKRLFGVFTKNDYGRGGAWPFYWGAFYPAGGSKTRDCQLFISLDETGFSYGFSIGDYASDNRKRLNRNVEENRDVLARVLADTLDEPSFWFGNRNRTESGFDPAEHHELDLAGWLKSISEVGPRVEIAIPWAQLLQMERDDLIARVTVAFQRLFPLVHLSTLEDPLPAIDSYLESITRVPGVDEELNPAYSLEQLAAETSLPKETLERWLRAIERKGQAILYGPPGTGKTYVAERLAKHLVAGDTGISELLQFHPAYAYEDFMQGIRPKARDGGGLDYPVVDGRFKQFCRQARGRKGLSVLVIDEVNRANLARVFGELMYLLEYRDKSIPLAAGGAFSIPGNVRIIGTMNTADRSIALVDHALRRRFAFLPLYPDYQMLTDFHAKADRDFDPAKLIEVLKELNRKIGDHHYEVGASFFMRADIEDQLPDVWRMEIEPYLEEYFFDQQATVDAYRWDEVNKKLGLE